MKMDFSNVSTYTLPGTDKIISELSFWVADETQVYELLCQIFIPGYGIEETTDETEDSNSGEDSDAQG